MSENAKLVQRVSENSLLKGVALQVYTIIANKPGLTVGEIAWEYVGAGQDDTALGRSRNELAKRVSDLVSWGAVKSNGRTLCPMTGRKANRYVVTGSLPAKDKTETRNLVQNPTMEIYPRRILKETNLEPFYSQSTIGVLLALRLTCVRAQGIFWLPKSLKLRAATIVTAVDEVLHGRW